MNAIVFDLELVKRFKKGQLSEIVEIGACKVDIEKKQMIDTLQIYILPKSGYVTKSTREFINMRKEDLKRSVPFRMGIEKFSQWLGKDYFLCSWGKDDKFHFVNQCDRLKVQLDWFKNYNDIQSQIGRILNPGSKNQLGLKNALELAGIEPLGKAHRGIDDAINTASLLLKFIDKIQLQFNTFTAEQRSDRTRIFEKYDK
ncbi:3'-5' exonuclease [Ammoniphilus resinae]|uniref:Inhibitor of KinA sporulation pathway (Predicted exonuclease) n=1 Tax=Ammoniphilus resinae TaxID=861532 RepID=A0ABS4GUN3_9BACL|nr:3'-5' exonuclease [Ammoniphilus resinae]MBP1933757.1 inhibitor of KinA sporulation pathway (predicted exonuclease) [Ammoniphilus resinae]